MRISTKHNFPVKFRQDTISEFPESTMNKALKQAMIEQHRKKAVLSKHRQQTQPLATESDQEVSFVVN
jgi:formaldehyde-activating enzyme involved in methanogenesis